MKKILLSLLCLFLFNGLQAGQDIAGYWKTIDDKTGKAQSIIAVYPYQGAYYGRIIATYDDKGSGQISDSIYNPQTRAPGVKGNPYYSGMDIIWGLQNNGTRFTNGSILDPEHGKVYGAELWVDQNGNLVVRGKLFFFGRNQTWLPLTQNDYPPNFQLPRLDSLVPSIPQVN